MVKRVWVLYRVSTKGQVDKDNDIPMQKIACNNYIKNFSGWTITKEIYERGLSGWKISEVDRDEMQVVKEGALNKEFDILLIFLADRLSRIKEEGPVIIQFLKKHNIAVHSVKEGELKAEEHTDHLINYIRYWQAEGESIKTSIRVKEKLKQMNEAGDYTGGRIPFGYDLIETDIEHPKKDKMLKDLIPNNDSKIIKIIFDLSANKNYGAHRIASWLNERGYVDNNGNKFNDRFINRILNNPIYIGLKRYSVKNYNNKNIKYKTQPYNEKYRIISDELFYRSQKMMKLRKKKIGDDYNHLRDGRPHASKVLLSGLIFCGYCGRAMYTDHICKKYTRKDGTVNKYINYRYRCLNGKDKIYPHPKSQVSAKTLDLQIEEDILFLIKKIDLNKLDDKLKIIGDKELENKISELNNLRKKLIKKEKNLTVLNNEIPKSLLGESSFSPEMLSDSIENIKNKINNINDKILLLENEVKDLENNYDKSFEMKKFLNELEGKFKNADLDAKKVLLHRLVSRIDWCKDKLKIVYRDNLNELIF